MVTITALLLVVVVGVAALAVDVSYWYSKAAEMQSSADSAALGAVVDRVTKGGNLAQARQEAIELLGRNGQDTSKVDIRVEDAGNNQVRVTIVNNDVGVFFGKVFQANMSITRSAVAEYNACEATCSSETPLSKPFREIKGASKGDGFVPILAGATGVQPHDVAIGSRIYYQAQRQNDVQQHSLLGGSPSQSGSSPELL